MTSPDYTAAVLDRAQPADVELVDDAAEFFAPVSSDVVDGLIGQYRSMRAKVERVASVMTSPDLDGAFHYFAEAAGIKDRHLSYATVETMFNGSGAVAALNAAFWSKAMHLTDVLDCMPQARRDEWHKSIREHQTPEFTDETVRATLTGLLAQRERFFAERVDGLFRSLSGTHVTNAPEAFGRRMIMAGAINSYGSPDHSRCGVINDLRAVIAKFMGRDGPGYDSTTPVIRYARERTGEWVSVDGGALRLRCYMVGTAHLEVHPDMAWRLNQILASLHPLAIPAKFRQRPAKRSKEFRLIGRPLPFVVIGALSGFEQARELAPDRGGWNRDTWVKVPGVYTFRGAGGDSQAGKEAGRVLESIGGAPTGRHRWAFDYDPTDIVREIVASGCLPDKQSHQFYPTPARLARVAVEHAQIDEEHICLEPSAGMGGLAEFMPKDRTTCVEISKLHCDVLAAKGHAVEQGDFLDWAGTTYSRFDRVVMNPPFSDGRWQAHTLAASRLVKPAGRLVAILPASAKGKDLLPPGWDCSWHGPYNNEFPGTSVSVVILSATREAA